MVGELTVLILSAGKSRRWDGVLKQLLMIDGESILARQVRQVKARSECEITVVTHQPEIASIAYAEDVKAFDPDARGCTCESLLSARDLWGERTLVLLGDVVYSWYAMSVIFSNIEDAAFFGNEAEIYAVVFDKSEHKDIGQLLKQQIAYQCDEATGKLRQFYERYAALPAGGLEYDLLNPPPPEERGYILHWIRDYTKDFDFPIEYKNFQRLVIDRGMLNDTLTRGP